jgi:ribosomal-protein-alanine N-acetyltransferase
MRALIVSPSADMLVAVRGRDPVGYAGVLRRRGSATARLYSLAVHPDELGKGYGRLLLAAAERAARQAGAHRLRLEVRADNAAAAALYASAGYRASGRRDDYYADGMAALLFQRDLAAVQTAKAA